MSSNNELRIEKYKTGWMVSDNDADCSGGHFIQDESFQTLEDAIGAANKYQSENEVEYGLNIILEES